MANFRTVTTRALSILFFGLGSTQCNDVQCESLRDELTAAKLEWQRCTSNEDCIIIGGNAKDCTGVLSCNFAVRRDARLEAERRVVSLPEESVDCMQCSPPNCVTGDIAVCEPVSQRCILVESATAPEPSSGTP